MKKIEVSRVTTRDRTWMVVRPSLHVSRAFDFCCAFCCDIMPYPQRFIRRRYSTYTGGRRRRSRYGVRKPVYQRTHALAMRAPQGSGAYAKFRAPPRAFASRETKFYDDLGSMVGGALGQYSQAWSAYYVPGMVKGTGVNNRIGNQVYAKSLEMKILFARDSAGAAVQRVKWVVVKERDPVNAAPIATEVFQFNNVFEAPRNLDYLRSYEFLGEGVCVLDSAANNAMQVNKTIPLNFVMKFSGNAGTVADVTENSIFILAWGDQAANKPTINGFYRLAFYDA